MIQKIIFFLLLFSLSLFANNFNQHEKESISWRSMYSLPQNTIDKRFQSVKKEVDDRWNLLSKSYTFPNYSSNLEEDFLAQEFYTFSDLRLQLWHVNSCHLPCETNPHFQISQQLLLKGRFRQPACITFEHSMTDSSYNSSCIQVGKRRFFALEGPLEEHVPFFFRLLINWKVASVVCLTDETDDHGFPKCFPYWQNRIINKQGKSFLRVPIAGEYGINPIKLGFKDLPYLFWPDWKDHHGIDPKQLVETVNHVRKNVSEHEIIAVHCSAGVGRTGTFISCLCLLDAIDEQLAKGVSLENIQINIAELFLYLNFHRPWLVAKPSQYITLYKTAEYYLKQKNNELFL